MYLQIEKDYQKMDPLKVINYQYWYIGFAFSAIWTFVFYLWRNFWMVTFSNIVTIILFFYFYFHYLMKKYLHKVERRYPIVDRWRILFKTIKKTQARNLLHILKYWNIQSQDDIKILLEYYSAKIPSKTIPNLLEIAASFFVTLASIAVLTIDENGNIVLEKLLNLLTQTILIILIPLAIFYFLFSFLLF